MKIIIIFLLAIISGLTAMLINLNSKISWNEQRYQDYVTLMDAAMERQTLITMPDSCKTQLENADMVMIKIIR